MGPPLTRYAKLAARLGRTARIDPLPAAFALQRLELGVALVQAACSVVVHRQCLTQPEQVLVASVLRQRLDDPFSASLHDILTQPVALAPDNQAYPLDLTDSCVLTPFPRAKLPRARAHQPAPGRRRCGPERCVGRPQPPGRKRGCDAGPDRPQHSAAFAHHSARPMAQQRPRRRLASAPVWRERRQHLQQPTPAPGVNHRHGRGPLADRRQSARHDRRAGGAATDQVYRLATHLPRAALRRKLRSLDPCHVTAPPGRAC